MRCEFDFTQAPQSVRDRSVLTFYTQNVVRLRGAKISMENLRGTKIPMENLRGTNISVENLRGLNFHYFPKNTPTGYPDLKKTGPLNFSMGLRKIKGVQYYLGWTKRGELLKATKIKGSKNIKESIT